MLVGLYILWPGDNFLVLSDSTSARRFCAYGQVYVEFEHHRKSWGTTFLDERGRPVKCDGEDDSDINQIKSDRESV